MKKFKIGDVVRLRKDSKFWGQSGDTEGEVVGFANDYEKVVTPNPQMLYIYVTWKDGAKYSYREQDLDIVETIQKAEATIKFKIGDRVVLRKDSEYAYQSNGKDGTITELEHGEYRYRIRWDNGHSNCYRAIDIRLVKDFTSLVDKYIVVYDEEDGEAFYQVVEDNGCFDDDGSRYVKVIGVDFNKVVRTTLVNVMIDNGNERTYGFLIPLRIAWLNRVLTKSAYINFADWSETMSEEDKLIIECLQRYPNLKIGESFGFVKDAIVKELHPRNWTVECGYSNFIYLAKSGEGGVNVYREIKDGKPEWAERTSVTLAPPPGVIYYNSTAPSTEIFIPSPIEKTPLLNRKSKIKQLKIN